MSSFLCTSRVFIFMYNFFNLFLSTLLSIRIVPFLCFIPQIIDNCSYLNTTVQYFKQKLNVNVYWSSKLHIFKYFDNSHEKHSTDLNEICLRLCLCFVLLSIVTIRAKTFFFKLVNELKFLIIFEKR